jgi:cytochrome oxidase Cu insertion factor (SCO1/SenC/PrrC family)
MKRILSVLIAISFALSGCTAEEEKIEFNGTEYHEPVSVPDFTLTDQEGNNVSLSDFKGKVVVVAFIFTSCPDVCHAI